MKGLNRSAELDLISHASGGDFAAAEGAVKYLQSRFGDNIRVIIPQIVKNAETM